MFEWPRFAATLGGCGTAERRVAALLAELGEPGGEPAATDVLSALFDDSALVDELATLAPQMHHVGVIAPPGVATVTISGLFEKSAFRSRMRQFKSAILAKDLSARLGRDVDVLVIEGRADAGTARYPGVEIFVADLEERELDSLVSRETGCHLALGLAPNRSIECVRKVLHRHDRWELPLMRDGALVNHQIGSSVLYIDIEGGDATRRLEFISSAP